MIRQFVSYPKSGRTWIRYILVQLGFEHHIIFHHDTFEFNDGNCPPHNFDINQRLLQTSITIDKLVYLERDPRDVIVSLYFQVTGRFKDFYNYQGNISQFIRDDYFGAYNLHKFREMWTCIAKKNNYLVVSYEECHQNMFEVLSKILDYYVLSFNPQNLVQAIENAEFSRMKQLEKSEQFPHPWLRPRQGSPKVRLGKVGGFRLTLDEDDICYLNNIFKM